MREDQPGLAAPSKLEVQIGEMIGTVKMTVMAVETLRQTVESLAERAAFKTEIVALRTEFLDRINRVDQEIERENKELKASLDSASSKLTALQKMLWIAVGGASTLGFLLRFVDIPAKITFGS